MSYIHIKFDLIYWKKKEFESTSMACDLYYKFSFAKRILNTFHLSDIVWNGKNFFFFNWQFELNTNKIRVLEWYLWFHWTRRGYAVYCYYSSMSFLFLFPLMNDNLKYQVLLSQYTVFHSITFYYNEWNEYNTY